LRPIDRLDCKRLKRLQNTHTDFAAKYNKLKQRQQRAMPKLFMPVQPLRPKEKESLYVRKIEKTLMDAYGNEYRVTVERV
jgi:hypothetical protein